MSNLLAVSKSAFGICISVQIMIIHTAPRVLLFKLCTYRSRAPSCKSEPLHSSHKPVPKSQGLLLLHISVGFLCYVLFLLLWPNIWQAIGRRFYSNSQSEDPVQCVVEVMVAGKSVRWTVTSQPQSGNREQWMLVLSFLFPSYSVWDSSPWNNAALTQGGWSQTWLEVSFLPESKQGDIGNQDWQLLSHVFWFCSVMNITAENNLVEGQVSFSSQITDHHWGKSGKEIKQEFEVGIKESYLLIHSLAHA